jgi:hypothetical protein
MLSAMGQFAGSQILCSHVLTVAGLYVHRGRVAEAGPSAGARRETGGFAADYPDSTEAATAAACSFRREPAMLGWARYDQTSAGVVTPFVRGRHCRGRRARSRECCCS